MFFFGNSRTGAVARSVDWTATSLGHPDSWPNSLKLILGMLFENKQPVSLFWGPDHKYFYNDSFIPIVGAHKHPGAMGKKGKQVWGEIWELLIPQIDSVMSGKGATWNEDQFLVLIGDEGIPREAYFTYSYSAVFKEDGTIGGVLVTSTETTKRVVAEKNLREYQQSLKLALASAKMGAWEVNLETMQVTLSEEARAIFGFSKEYDSTDAAIDEFIHPDDRAQAREVLLNAIASGKSYDDVYRIVRPDGDTLWVNSKGQARYDHNGKPVLLVGLTFDITEKKLAEQALQVSEARFKQIGEALPQLVWTCRPDGWCDYLSSQWVEYTGMPEDIQLGFSWLEKVIHPEDKDRTTEHWLGAVEGKHPYDIEYRIRRYDGEYRWFKTRGTPIRNNNGQITYWFGTCTDIQDSKLAQLTFERNVDSSPSMLWITEKDGYCSYLSKQWYENTGQTSEIGLGFGWLEATHPDDMEMAGKVFKDANTNQVPFYHEYRLRHKNGEYRWSIDAGNPRYNEKGEYLGMAGTVFDIHDRKLAELKTEEALRARDEFLSIASHELKTPLTTLKLQAQLQKKMNMAELPKEIPQRFNSFLELADKQVARIARLVDDMLDVSRIRTGKLTFELEDIDFCELVSDVIKGLSNQFTKASYDIPVVSKCSNSRGHWDRMRLEQIVTNLLTNAIRYGNQKEITVAVEADEKNVILIVRDRGIGISEKDQAKIFDRFERSVNANDVSGLGLGLYITKQIVLSFRGEISVESSVGQGSTFRVVIPKT